MKVNFFIRSSETCNHMLSIKLAAHFNSSHHRKCSWSACDPHVAGIEGYQRGKALFVDTTVRLPLFILPVA